MYVFAELLRVGKFCSVEFTRLAASCREPQVQR